MNEGKSVTSRDWRVIAEELTRETDSSRVLELTHELTEALDRQRLDLSAPTRKVQVSCPTPSAPDQKPRNPMTKGK